MPFPEVSRVIYRKNPLNQVICQLRFPPILRIDTELPAPFQERIQNVFPEFEEGTEWKMELPKNIVGPMPSETYQQILQSTGNKNYVFISEDGEWRVNLTRTFIALTTNKYYRWEEFRDKLGVPLDAFLEVYSPSHFTRVGLRYIDVIKRSMLNFDGIEWKELLKPYVIGVIGSGDVGNNVDDFESRSEINLEEGQGRVRMITKLFNDPENGEVCFAIDSDFFYGKKTSPDMVIDKLVFFNSRSSRLIQWVVTPRLHQAMEPQEL